MSFGAWQPRREIESNQKRFAKIREFNQRFLNVILTNLDGQINIVGMFKNPVDFCSHNEISRNCIGAAIHFKFKNNILERCYIISSLLEIKSPKQSREDYEKTLTETLMLIHNYISINQSLDEFIVFINLNKDGVTLRTGPVEKTVFKTDLDSITISSNQDIVLSLFEKLEVAQLQKHIDAIFSVHRQMKPFISELENREKTIDNLLG